MALAAVALGTDRAGGAATLAAVLITEENWRGKRAWENYRHVAEARGERLDLAFVIPPAVPDDQNFFCAPIVTNASEKFNNLQHLSWQHRRDWPTNGGNWQKRKLTDLKQWQDISKIQPVARRQDQWLSHRGPTANPRRGCSAGVELFRSRPGGFPPSQPAPARADCLNYEEGFEDVGDLVAVPGCRKTVGAVPAIARAGRFAGRPKPGRAGRHKIVSARD